MAEMGRPRGTVKDIKDEVFTRLTAKEHIGRGFWKCVCICGNVKIVDGLKLRSGHTRSCGCLMLEVSRKAKPERRKPDA